MKFSAFKIALLYFIFAIAWILFSDQAFLFFFPYATLLHFTFYQSAKGIFFVLITAIILFFILRNYYSRLQKSAEEYKKLFLENPLPMWIYDLDTYSFLEVNNATVKKYGYSRKEFLSMSILNIRPTEDVEAVKKIAQSAPSEKFSDPVGWRHLKKDGSLIFVNILSHTITFHAKKAKLVFAQDITDKVRAEKEAAFKEIKLNALINSTDDLIWSLDKDLRINAMNKAYHEFLFLLTGENLKLGDNAILKNNSPKEIQKWKDYYARALGGEIFRQEEAAAFADGTTMIAEIRFNPVYDEEHDVRGVVCIARNITVRKLNELKLKELLQRYSILFKATNDAIWDWDMTNNHTTYNDNFWHIFKYLPVDDPGNLWEDNIHENDRERVLKGIEKKLENKENLWADEYLFRCADGTHKYVLDRAYIMYDERQQPVRMIGAMQDIQQQKEYEEAIKHQNKSLREIAWISSHVIRGPVSAILGLSHLFDENDNDKKEDEKIVGLIKESATQLDQVIHNIVDKTNQIKY